VTDESDIASSPQVVIAYEGDSDTARRRAIEWTERLALPLADAVDTSSTALRLVVTDTRLELRRPLDVRERPFYVDFVGRSARARRVTPHTGKELIARAVGLKGGTLFVVDATAGFARDAFVLAQLGCRVHAIERSPVVAALVEDGLTRARAVLQRKFTEALVRLTIEVGDARRVLSEPPASACADARSTLPQEAPDVVYLDPMYPASRKSALNRKELRMLRTLVGDDDDATELFAVARRVALRRVVVKRPFHAPPLAPDPDIQFKGSSVRFDVYLADTKRP